MLCAVHISFQFCKIAKTLAKVCCVLFLLVPVLAVVCCELDGEDQMENLNDIKVKISCKNGCLEKKKKDTAKT